MTTTKTSALDGFKLEYEDMKPKIDRITLKKNLKLKIKRPSIIRAYFNYLVELILQ